MTDARSLLFVAAGIAGGLLLSGVPASFLHRAAETPTPAAQSAPAAAALAPAAAPVVTPLPTTTTAPPIEIRVVQAAPEPARRPAARDDAPARRTRPAPPPEEREPATAPSEGEDPPAAPETAQAAADPQPPPAAAVPARPREVEIPAGIALRAQLRDPISSATALAGDEVAASLMDPVLVGDDEVLPAGTLLRGVVQDARPAGRVKGNGRLALLFREAELPGGTRVPLGASWEQTALGKHKRDAGIIGGTAAGGALLGQAFGKDTEGTLTGAVLGAAIGTGIVLANRGREVELPAGQLLVLQLQGAARIPVSG